MNKTTCDRAWEQGLADGLEEGLEKGREVGRAEGTGRATRAVLTELLEAKFGTISPKLLAPIETENDVPRLRAMVIRAGKDDSLDSFLRNVGLADQA